MSEAHRVCYTVVATVRMKRPFSNSYAKSLKKQSLFTTKIASYYRHQRQVATTPIRCRTSHNIAVKFTPFGAGTALKRAALYLNC